MSSDTRRLGGSRRPTVMNELLRTGLLSSTSAPVSVLAFVSTIHCAMLMLVRHQTRTRFGLVLLPSIVFVACPWFLATPLWLAVVLATHVGWVIVCEKLIRPATEIQPANAPKPRRSDSAAASPTPRLVPSAQPSTQSGFVAQPVLAVFSETPDIRTFRFARPEGFTFTPGQFVMVRVEIDGKPVVRCYSVSSSTAASGYLEISVRRQGNVSGFLHATVRPGSLLQVRGPGGTFVYPEGRRPIVLLAGGIGITPLLSMLRHAVDHEPSRPVTLVFSAKTEEQMPFLDDLRLLARRHPQFRLVVALSQGSDKNEYFSGRIDRALIETAVDHLRESVYLICGPAAMIEQMRTILESVGVPRTQVHYEKFEAAVAAATASVGSGSGLRPGSGPVAGTSVALSLRLQRSGRVVTVEEGQTILEAAECAGESLPSMCRAGVCGTCQVQLVQGDVEGEFDIIDESDRANGGILACVARPVTNCVIDA